MLWLTLKQCLLAKPTASKGMSIYENMNLEIDGVALELI
jgi:hypothetical protein